MNVSPRMGDGSGDGQVRATSSDTTPKLSPLSGDVVNTATHLEVTSIFDSSPLNDIGSQKEDLGDEETGTVKETTLPEGGRGPNGGGKGNRRLYIGNLALEVKEENLREFFESNGFEPECITRVMVRQGYAFVECQDSAVASRIADTCNMKGFMNTLVRVEPAEKPAYKSKPPQLSRQRSVTQLLVKNCAADTNLKDVQQKFSQFGAVTVEHGLRPGCFVVHTMGSKQSDALINEFHGKPGMGSTRLVVHNIPDNTSMMFDGSGDAHNFSSSRSGNSWKATNGTSLHDNDYPRGSSIPTSAYAAYQTVVQQAAEPPLKILVPNEFVGAVIGRGGATIRAISKGTGARLDIFRNCSRYDVPEKPVTIYGPPEKASKACRKILEIIIQENNHHQELQMQQHQQAPGQQQPPQKQDIALRMFAQDSYIGRVIGKGGSVIKKIMEDTQTKIHISTQSDFMGKDSTPTNTSNRHYFPPVMERLITIRGTIDGMCKAEEIISEKLREAYQNETRFFENGYSGQSGNNFSASNSRTSYVSGSAGSDEEYIRPPNGPTGRRKFTSRTPFTLSTNVNNMNVSQYIPGGTYATYPTSATANSSTFLNNGMGYWSNTDYAPHQQQHHQQSNLSRPESVNMYIPDDVVGALIGRKGSNIRQIIQQTGASVKIMEETLFIEENPMRRVVIHGVIDALFKAQYFIYDKVVEEGKGPVDHQIDDIRLTVEMSVPTEMVGRLIGKAGQNIREIQKNFLCRIKFMTDPDETLPVQHPGETYVRITGNYNAFLGAQKKIREMLIKAMTRSSFRGFGGGRRKNDSELESGNASGNSEDDAALPIADESQPQDEEMNFGA